MGGCLSKKSTGVSSPNALQKTHEEVKSCTQGEKKAEVETVKRKIFIIKHRKSHEIGRMFETEDRNSKNGELVNNYGIIGSASVRTSSCTKEELGAISTQCGKLSRSSTTEKSVVLGSGGSAENNASNLQKGRKCIVSKRGFDFDNDNGRDGCSTNEKNVVNGGNDEVVDERESRHRRRPSQAGEASSSFQGRRRRRTRSRECEPAEQQLRSDSTERGSSCGGGGRRVSRSPGPRSESPITSYANSSSANVNGDRGSKPGKMVSVPATISSLAMDNSNNAAGGEPVSTAAVKRIHVRRNVGAGDNVVGSRTIASPRARSPAMANSRVCNENQNINTGQNQQHPISLSRSNSRKAEHSPYRRIPLSEIDTNVIVDHIPPSPGIMTKNNILSLKPNADNNRVVQGAKNKLDKSLTSVNCKAKEQPQLKVEETIGSYGLVNNVVTSGDESLQHLPKMRSRSSHLSRDLDINLEELSNPSPSYTALLLEDIHKFHQKNNTLPTFSLPPCLTRACSILEAVADLNSTTSSNLSSTFSDERRRRNPLTEKFTKRDSKDCLVESEVVANDDLIEPSFQRYVTVRKGTADHGDLEQQESSGSNSFISSQQHRDSSSWEPNSVESNGRTSSRSIGRQTDRSPLGFQKHAISEPTRDADGTGNSLSIKKTDFDYQLK